MKRLLTLFLKAGLLLTLLSGCLNSDNDKVEEQPDPVPVEYVLIVQDDVSVGAGEQVTLTSQLSTTENGESVIWTQLSGRSVEFTLGSEGSISFVAPNVTADVIKFEVTAVDSTGEVLTDLSGNPLSVSLTVIVSGPGLVLDVVDGVTHWWEIADPSHNHYVEGANDDTHTADNIPGGTLSFLVSDRVGYYDLNVRYLIPENYGAKVARVNVNGVELFANLYATGQWEAAYFGVVHLLEGENTIVVGGGHNYYRVDEVVLRPAVPPVQPLPVSHKLVNPNPIPQSANLMRFLTKKYSLFTVSGQVDVPVVDNEQLVFEEFNTISQAIGGAGPGMLGFDMKPYSTTYAEKHPQLSEQMANHYKNGEVVLAPFWTWNAPAGETSDSLGFKRTETNFDLAAALADTQSYDYLALLSDIDLIAQELETFAKDEIPLIWRPLPQADSNEYWWGAAGAEAVKSLWQLMYDRLVNYHELNNLIWVFGFSDQVDMTFYPGDDFVDIVALEVEGNRDQQALFKRQYQKLKDNFDGIKLIALSASSTIPDVSYLHEQGVYWSYYMTAMTDENGNGPGHLSENEIDKGYSAKSLDASDVPGYTHYIEPGVYMDFDGGGSFEREGGGAWAVRAAFDFKVDWYPRMERPNYSNAWSNDGEYSLAHSVSIAEEVPWGDFPSVAFIHNPNLHLKDINTLNVTVNSLEAGENVTAKLFVRHGNNLEWLDSGAITITEGGTKLTLAIEHGNYLDSWGVIFEGFDIDSESMKFFLDTVVFE